MCEVLFIMWPKLPLLEGWPNVILTFFPMEGLNPQGMETEVGVWPKGGKLDDVIPVTCEKVEDDEAVDFGTRNA